MRSLWEKEVFVLCVKAFPDLIQVRASEKKIRKQDIEKDYKLFKQSQRMLHIPEKSSILI